MHGRRQHPQWPRRVQRKELRNSPPPPSVLSEPVDRQEARVAAEDMLARLRGQSYEELAPLVHKSRWVNVDGASGARYGVKIYAIPDDGFGVGSLRILTSAMNGDKGRLGGWRSEGAEFIISPDGHIDA
jgi:hypothetical protein